MVKHSVQIPELGGDSASIAEILVQVGDSVQEGDSIAILETDKASVELEATASGVVVEILVAVGSNVSDGDVCMVLKVEQDKTATSTADKNVEIPAPEQQVDKTEESHSYTQVVGDLGGGSADVVELQVAQGDTVAEGDILALFETDKATVEVEAECSGVIQQLDIAVGNSVQAGDIIAVLATTAITAATEISETSVESTTQIEQYCVVPDIGADSATIIELQLKVGDDIAEGDSIGVVETDKASSELGADYGGKVVEVLVSVGDQLQSGQRLIKVLSHQTTLANTSTQVQTQAQTKPMQTSGTVPTASSINPGVTPIVRGSKDVYAGPAVRFLARKLGVDLGVVPATGPRGRIIADDLHNYVRQQLQGGSSSTAVSPLPERPKTDFSKFGEVDVKPLSKIHKVTIANMMRSWLNTPIVTQFDDADITDLESYRQSLKPEMAKKGVKITPVAFLIKAIGLALEQHPKFNSSIDPQLENSITRKYINIGVAVATDKGLFVPVVKGVDKMDIWKIGERLTDLSSKARSGTLSLADMSGSCFTISSLGAIGGTGFTPIVNSPEVGILGVSKTQVAPVWSGSEFVPRSMLPMALSYDHNAINGADAGAFMTDFITILQDLHK